MAPTAPRWYLARNRQKYRPYSLQELRQFTASGSLVTSDTLLQEGATAWIDAESIPILATHFTQAVPPVVTTYAN